MLWLLLVIQWWIRFRKFSKTSCHIVDFLPNSFFRIVKSWRTMSPNSLPLSIPKGKKITGGSNVVITSPIKEVKSPPPPKHFFFQHFKQTSCCVSYTVLLKPYTECSLFNEFSLGRRKFSNISIYRSGVTVGVNRG